MAESLEVRFRELLEIELGPSEPDPKTIEELDERLRRPKGTDRVVAARHLAALFPEHATSRLEALAEDRWFYARAVALDQLCLLSGRDSWPLFVRSLDDESDTVRRSAWDAIRQLSGTGDVPEILRLADSHPRFARAMRARARHLEREPRYQPPGAALDADEQEDLRRMTTNASCFAVTGTFTTISAALSLSGLWPLPVGLLLVGLLVWLDRWEQRRNRLALYTRAARRAAGELVAPLPSERRWISITYAVSIVFFLGLVVWGARGDEIVLLVIGGVLYLLAMVASYVHAFTRPHRILRAPDLDHA